jgi:hypothetical protein
MAVDCHHGVRKVLLQPPPPPPLLEPGYEVPPQPLPVQETSLPKVTLPPATFMVSVVPPTATMFGSEAGYSTLRFWQSS